MKSRQVVQLDALIYGRVQGVGYRYFVEKHATQDNLKGWVKNLSDGSVECSIQGSRIQLDSLLEKLKRGPSLSRVDDVSCQIKSPLFPYSSFEILF